MPPCFMSVKQRVSVESFLVSSTGQYKRDSVVAVAHLGRCTGYWQDRLEDRDGQ